MFEVLTHYLPQIEKSDVLQRLNLEKISISLVSSHRGGKYQFRKNFSSLIDSLNAA